jgi:ABC-type branched-subunit amino acid transport system substrate-binding protein
MRDLVTALRGVPAASERTATTQPAHVGGSPRPRARTIAVSIVGVAVVVTAILVGRSALRSRVPTNVASGSSAVALPGPPPECTTSRDCVSAHGGDAYRCNLPDGVCAPLASEDCKVLAEPGDVENDATVWIGTLFPLTNPDGSWGRTEMQAVDLARRDFAETLGKFANAEGIRPIGVISCDDAVEPHRAASHLVNDVRSPAVIGFRTSTEAIDLDATYFIPNGTLAISSINLGATVTAVPQPAGERLIWRTTYSLNASAVPLAGLVSDVLVPAARASVGHDAEPLRIAFVRDKSPGSRAFAAEVLKVITFNGKSGVENGNNYRELVYDDADDLDSGARFGAVVDALRAFLPNIVLYHTDETFMRGVVEPLEAKWPADKPRPLYAKSNVLSNEIFNFVAHDPARRHRFFGLTSTSGGAVNANFVVHYNETFSPKISRAIAPNTSYDSFYILAYAIQALGSGTPTGASIARDFARLIPPGSPVDVGPAAIFDAYKLLRSGGHIDLNGTSGALDLDAETGESPVNMSVLCVGVDAHGDANGAIESGLVFDQAKHAFVGAMQCP